MFKKCSQFAVTVIFAVFVSMVGFLFLILFEKVFKSTSLEEHMIWFFAVMLFLSPFWFILAEKKSKGDI